MREPYRTIDLSCTVELAPDDACAAYEALREASSYGRLRRMRTEHGQVVVDLAPDHAAIDLTHSRDFAAVLHGPNGRRVSRVLLRLAPTPDGACRLALRPAARAWRWSRRRRARVHDLGRETLDRLRADLLERAPAVDAADVAPEVDRASRAS